MPELKFKKIPDGLLKTWRDRLDEYWMNELVREDFWKKYNQKDLEEEQKETETIRKDII